MLSVYRPVCVEGHTKSKKIWDSCGHPRSCMLIKILKHSCPGLVFSKWIDFKKIGMTPESHLLSCSASILLHSFKHALWEILKIHVVVELNFCDNFGWFGMWFNPDNKKDMMGEIHSNKHTFMSAVLGLKLWLLTNFDHEYTGRLQLHILAKDRYLRVVTKSTQPNIQPCVRPQHRLLMQSLVSCFCPQGFMPSLSYHY